MSKVYIGIDPGKEGFITVFIDGVFHFFQIPKINTSVDYSDLSNIFIKIKGLVQGSVHCVLEDVHAIFGASSKSTFEFGHITGFIEGCLNSLNIPYTKVQPKKWQKDMWQGVSLMTRPSSTGKTSVTDTKGMSLMAAKRLFPEIDLTATERSKKPHDGKVDSLLMCEYARRNF